MLSLNKKILLLLYSTAFIVSFQSVCFSEDAFVVHANQALQGYSKERGLNLSDKAIKSLELKFFPYTSQADLSRVPLESIVYFGENVGVYRFREGWFKLIHIQIFKKNADVAQIKTKDLQPGDQIVSQNAAFLRVTEMDASSGDENHDE